MITYLGDSTVKTLNLVNKMTATAGNIGKGQPLDRNPILNQVFRKKKKQLNPYAQEYVDISNGNNSMYMYTRT